VPTPDTFPPRASILLPSRAFLLSVREQTLPARLAAIDDAVDHFEEADTSADIGWRDMALLGVIAEAMQPFEDLAYLATAWDKPFNGLAHYVRATVYSSRTPTNFWQEAPRWADERLAVFAGLSTRDPSSGEISDVIDALGLDAQLSPEKRYVLAVARDATIRRLLAWAKCRSRHRRANRSGDGSHKRVADEAAGAHAREAGVQRAGSVNQVLAEGVSLR
jgi:hypothetical protein